MLHSTIINNDICASAFTKRWQFIFDNIILPNINWFEQFLQFLQKYNIIYSQWSVPLHLKAHNTWWNRKHSQMLDGFSCNWQKVNSHFFCNHNAKLEDHVRVTGHRLNNTGQFSYRGGSRWSWGGQIRGSGDGVPPKLEH